MLFVDDEPRVLEGILRTLRPQRAELTALTAGGGPEALALLAHEHVDVLVSDMRMPGMDGAELLSQVRLRHPRIVRLILSGQSDQATIVRAARAAHQYLSKPCDPQELRRSVLRSCALRDLLDDAALAARITALDGLPSAPGALAALRAELARDCDHHDVAAIIDADPGLAAKLIQMTATSFFGTPRGIISPSGAAQQLGVDVLRALAQAEALPGPSVLEIDWTRWSGKAYLAAVLARRFANEVDPHLADAAETAGLLHDCATAVLAMTSSGAYRVLGAQAARQHADVSAFMLGLWGLPDAVVEAVARHHRPSLRLGQHDLLCGLVHIAAMLASGRRSALDMTFIGTLACAAQLDGWIGVQEQRIRP